MRLEAQELERQMLELEAQKNGWKKGKLQIIPLLLGGGWIPIPTHDSMRASALHGIAGGPFFFSRRARGPHLT